MRILVVGAGATGGYFGARLAEAGRDVTFLVRPGRAGALRERGLRVVGPRGDVLHELTPRLVTADQIDGPYDLVLLSVKATALKPALDDLAPAVGAGTAIVPFLNGIAHMDALNDRFGRLAVLGGVVRVVTTLADDGDIVQLAPLATMAAGEQDGGVSERARAVGAALDGAGFDLAVSPNIMAEMWSKWVFIATVGALTCLLRGTVGDIAAVPGGIGVATALLHEIAAVASAAGYPVPEHELATVRASVTQVGSAFASSMYRDVMAGRPTEVEHVLADLAARGATYGVPTPLLDLATLGLRVHERGARAAGA